MARGLEGARRSPGARPRSSLPRRSERMCALRPGLRDADGAPADQRRRRQPRLARRARSPPRGRRGRRGADHPRTAVRREVGSRPSWRRLREAVRGIPGAHLRRARRRRHGGHRRRLPKRGTGAGPGGGLIRAGILTLLTGRGGSHMTFIRPVIALSALVAMLVPGLARADEMVSEERVAPANRLATNVAIRDVRVAGDTVSGVVVNRSPNPVRDVRLVVSHDWLWDNEFHPGDDEYSRADHYIVRDEIPPGGEVPFTIRPTTPLTEGRGGHFMTSVAIASVAEIVKGNPPAPTAGTRGVEPAPRGYEGDPTRGVQPAP